MQVKERKTEKIFLIDKKASSSDRNATKEKTCKFRLKSVVTFIPVHDILFHAIKTFVVGIFAIYFNSLHSHRQVQASTKPT